MKKHIISILVLFVILILLSCLIPVQATNLMDTTSNELEQHLSSLEMFCLRKAYPYDYKALQYQEYFTGEQTTPNALEQVLSSSSSVLSSIGLSEPMNSSWPMKSYNSQRIGRTTSSTVDNPGLEKWRFQTWISGVDSGAVVTDDNTIIFGSKDYRAYALFPNGTLKWKYKTGGSIYSTPAIAADGTIYIASCNNYLYALRPSGTLKWQFNLQYISFSSPVLANNGTIYICTAEEGKLFAVNPNGTAQWFYDAGSGMYGDPCLGIDGTIYVGTWDNYLNAINPNGTLKWRFPTGNHVKGVPSIAPDGTIYFGSWDGYLYALYTNGTMRWRCGVGSGSETTPAIAEDGTIYVGGDELYAVYPNGTMRWSLALGSERFIFMSCPAIAAEGTIYVGVSIGNGVGGEILAVNPNGTERWRKIISDEKVDSSPAIAADGTVYIGSTGGGSGYLHAFGVIESNAPPNNPSIEGPINGEAGTIYGYHFAGVDPDNNPVRFFIDWGDGTTYETRWCASGESTGRGHSWAEQGTYIIKAKTQDVLGLESNWTSMEVTMPYSYEPEFPFIHWLLEHFPNAFPILRFLLEFNH
jgi:outer membrane protein assembly factor BamB